jgi:Icc-related predicted phosphoesterase
MKNSLNILALADIHGRIPKLPKSITDSDVDVLMLCGDICGHFNKNWDFNDYFQRMVNVPAESADQRGWIVDTLKPWIDKTLKPKHTIFVNGNHDFGDFHGIFEHYLFKGSKNIEVEGVKIGVLAGSGMLSNEWSDEIDNEEFKHRIAGLDKDIQIIVSHMPPYGIMDRAHNGDRIGSPALVNAIFGRMGSDPYFTKLERSFFGHCHEARNDETHEIEGRQVHFHNVAERYVAVEFKKEV